jgi:hypothetical protein
MPWVGKSMDRKRNERISKYLATTYCETHKRTLGLCRPGDVACMVCGCGGLCDSKEPCPMQKRPLYGAHI